MRHKIRSKSHEIRPPLVPLEAAEVVLLVGGGGGGEGDEGLDFGGGGYGGVRLKFESNGGEWG